MDLSTIREFPPECRQSPFLTVDRQKYTEGYFGLTGYGALDFEVNRIEIGPGKNMAQPTHLNQLHVCYPLKGSLQQVDGECVVSSFRRSETVEAVLRSA